MPFACTRPKTKDDLYRNHDVEKRISQSSVDNVDLSNMNLTDEDIPIILEKAIRKKKCTSLSLTSNQITADGLQILTNNLKSNKKLTHLILSSNPIGDQGMKYIRELLETNRILVHLSLASTNITDDGLKLIIHVLLSNTTSLRSLDLRSNPSITDSSLDLLFQMAERNETLSACRLENCGISEQGKEALQQNKSIKW